jgi:O-antigen ligase
LVLELLEIEAVRNSSITALEDPYGEWRFVLLTGAILTSLFVALVVLGEGKPGWLLALPALGLLLMLLKQVELTLGLLVVVLFVDFPVSIFSSAVWFTIIVALAFLVNHRDFAWKELSSPLTVPLLVYGFAVLPSLLNAVNPWRCIAMFLNVFAFLTATYVTFMNVRTMDVIGRLTRVYLGMALVNALSLIPVAVMSGRRDYGFAGIMYVDYSGLAVSVLAAIALMSDGRRRVLALGVSFVVGIALVLTQTRNAWLSALITLVFVAGYVVRYPFLAGLSRKQMFSSVVAGGLLLAIVAGSAIFVNPAIEQRAMDVTRSGAIEAGESVLVQNSVITRLMIWHTAYNAFVAHPWIGIGVYGFAQASQLYSRLPPLFYDRYVRGNSAHVTFFAVLVETGIVGMVGFLVFLGSILRVAFRSVHEVVGIEAQRNAFVGLVAIIYCTVSMFFTDAWMWGQGIVLWGLIVGLVLANRRINSTQEIRAGQTTLRGSEG